MTTRIDRRVDGITVDNYEARFTGRIPLETDEASASAIDDVLVMVVVVRVDNMTAKVDKSGDLTRTNVMKVTDARLVEGELRNVLVERLGLYGEDTVPPAMVVHEDQGTLFEEEAPPADPATGEITTTWVTHGGEMETVSGGVEVVGQIKKGNGTPRPGVMPFDATDGPLAGPAGGQVVGHINERQDKALAGYLSEV